MHRTFFPALAAFAAFSLAVLPAVHAQTSYTITDVGLLPDGTYSFGTGVNNSGQVTGYADAPNGQHHAFLYTPGAGITDLGTLPGGLFSSGAGINDAGQITGYADTSKFGIHPFLYSTATGMVDLGALGYDDGMFGNIGWAINNAGQVAGHIYVSDNLIHAFVYTPGTGYQDLGTLGGNDNVFGSIGYAINDAGQVTGNADTRTGSSHAFVYSAGTGMKDLGTLPGGTESVGYGINQYGQVTGTAYAANGESYAFLYSGGTMKNLGTLPQARDSDGMGINSSGTIVGDATLSNVYDRAVVYTRSAGMQDLNDLIPANSGWSLISALGISDTGLITGYGIYNGDYHAFLLTPVAASGPVKPVLLHLDPASRTVGRNGFTLTVLGTDFATNSLITWNGVRLTTAFVDSAHLTASIPAALIARAGTAVIRVFTSGAGASHPRVETIHPRPTLSALYPSRKTAGGPTFRLTVAGTGFLPSSIIKWNGAAQATTYIAPTQIFAQIPASYIAHAGTAGVTVTTPDVATSAHSKTFRIVAP